VNLTTVMGLVVEYMRHTNRFWLGEIPLQNSGMPREIAIKV